MGRTPRDVASLLDVMAGAHPMQPLSRPATPVAPLLAGASLDGVHIGFLGDWSGAYPMEAGVLDVVQDALALMAAAGAHIRHLDAPFPHERLWQAWCDLRSFADAAAKRETYEDPASRAQMKPEVLWEQERGRALDAMALAEASATRSDWYRTAAALFDDFDALVLPTAQVWPFPADWRYPREIEGKPMDTYHRWMEVVVPVSMLGLPAVTIPAGFSPQGWPMGMQVFGPMGSDAALLRIAEAWHRKVDFAGVAPSL
jgi:amidase